MSALGNTIGSASITTEYFISSGSGSSTPQTTPGSLQVFIDVSAMAAGDQYRIRLYEKTDAGTQTVFSESVLTGPQSKTWTSEVFLVLEGWDVSLEKLAGTARTLKWSLRLMNADNAPFALATDVATLLARLTASRAGYLDNLSAGAVAQAATALSTAQWTNGRAALIDHLTGDVATAAALATAQTAITAIKAKTDGLPAAPADESLIIAATNALATAIAAIPTTPATAAALATAQADLTTLVGRLTAPRATGLDNLDAAITSRASATAAAAIQAKTDSLPADPADESLVIAATDALATAIAAIPTTPALASALSTAQSDLTTLVGRLTAGRATGLDSLDAAVSSRAAASTALSTAQWTNALATALADTTPLTIADAVFDYVIEAAPAGATTFVQRLRILWSIFAAAANGLAIAADGTEHFRDGADTKDRAVFGLATDGTRTPGSFDGE